ncbi:MAG TPA: tetratricopeptide repeat protein [Gemmatimonadaceae bacterium]|nr:tetratricopeptide repeat protein [Gemmatimonadaceae bacterium]
MKLRRFSLPAMNSKSPILFSLGITFLSAGCFASKSDFEALQADILTARVSSNAADSMQRAQLVEVSRSLRTLNDSIAALSRRLAAQRTASESEMTAMRQDIQALQDLSGASEQRLRDLRASVEERTRTPEVPPVPDSTAGAIGAAQPVGPGPAQLLRDGRDQLLKGGNSAARSAFNELITRYPTSELVPEAVFYTAQAYTAERKPDAADSVYQVLITRYPASPRVPTAMYKRALQMQSAKKTADARRLFQEIIKRFPRSDEAALADERLQSLR